VWYAVVALTSFALGLGAAVLMLRYRGGDEADALRHFIYVSDDKVDMYFDQLRKRARDNWIHELKLNYKLASYSIKRSPNPIVTRTARLKAVLNELKAQELIGGVGSDKPYMAGIMHMKQGTYSTTDDSNFDVALFTGETDDGLTIALGGSARHLLENVSEERRSNSGLRGVLKGLEKASVIEQGLLERDEVAQWMQAGAWGSEVKEVWERTDGPLQKLEFVAVRLADGRGDSKQTSLAILGSPIYVALSGSDGAMV
jgi:hypothetical protein